MASYIDASHQGTDKPLVIPKEAVPGDIINYSEERYYNAYFLGWNGKLIKNTDINSGLLTIPIKITKHVKNAVKYYERVISERRGFIELGPKDQWIVKKYGEELPKDWITTYQPDGDEIWITFGSGEMVDFDLFTPLSRIKEYYSKLDEECYEYKLSITVKNKSKEWKRYEKSRNIDLPSTWRSDFAGSKGSLDNKKTTYRFTGPISDRKAAKRAIREYYTGYAGSDVIFLFWTSD